MVSVTAALPSWSLLAGVLPPPRLTLALMRVSTPAPLSSSVPPFTLMGLVLVRRPVETVKVPALMATESAEKVPP